MAKFIARVTVVTTTLGQTSSQVLYKPKKAKRKRLARWAKPLERLQRRVLAAQSVYSGELLARNRRSNRKHRNGFLRDGLTNMLRANRKAFKKLRKI